MPRSPLVVKLETTSTTDNNFSKPSHSARREFGAGVFARASFPSCWLLLMLFDVPRPVGIGATRPALTSPLRPSYLRIAPPRLKWRGSSCGRPPRRIPGAHRPGGVQAAWGSSRSGLHPRGPPGDACPPPFQTEACRVARNGFGEASSLGGSLASGPSVASATRPTPPSRRIARGLRFATPSFALHPRMGRRPAPPRPVRPSPRSPPRFVASARGGASGHTYPPRLHLPSYFVIRTSYLCEASAKPLCQPSEFMPRGAGHFARSPGVEKMETTSTTDNNNSKPSHSACRKFVAGGFASASFPSC